MWVIRAGQGAIFYEKYIKNQRVYIPWNGYHFDLSDLKTKANFRATVEKEKEVHTRTTISNWYGQLYSFVEEMEISDYVLIPSKGSHTYVLSKISGPYEYLPNEPDRLYHSRAIKIICCEIPRDIFSQSVIYSLGAFRTLFKARCEAEVLAAIEAWKKDENH